VEQYRLRHANALPASLAELAPEFLDTVPADPFDGHPLRYKKLPGKGYVVYAVGEARKDENQTTQPANDAKDKNPPTRDITFTVQR